MSFVNRAYRNKTKISLMGRTTQTSVCWQRVVFVYYLDGAEEEVHSVEGS